MTITQSLPQATTLTRLVHAVVLASGWRRAAIAFAAGAISVVGLAPFNVWPVLFLTFPVMVWLIDGAAASRMNAILRAAHAGWWFGFGYFLAGVYWVGYAFLVDAKTFGWLLPFAVIGLPLYLAFYTAFGFALARGLWTRGPVRVLALALSLTIAEWLRGHLFTGFPWNAYGYALTGPLVLAQASALLGLWGLTFLAVAIFASPATLADESADTRRPWFPLAVGFVTLAALTVYGAVRLSLNPTAFVDGVRLRIMQPNLPQDDKFNYGAKQRVMSRYINLSNRKIGPQSLGVGDATHLIWPESPFPFLLAREPDALAQIADLLPAGTVLITGGVRAPEIPTGTIGLRAYNSVFVIDHQGTILSIYDKVHLVPFGEYLPFQDFLERLGIMQLTKLPGGYLAGDRRRVLTAPRAPKFLPLICYEIIFPGAIVPNGERPDWLLNLTNDGWFGTSSGPYQHLQQARVRAIEEGLPLVRAANTGISAVVDPLGRTIKSLPLGAEGVLDSSLPRRVDKPLYARMGDTLLGLILGIVGAVVINRRRVR
ncbi:MAG TPA: apolipoprotein N-acyltransferase [Xanthobacteraceae bacterium]|nr:apolipoprotein N-acyltransferase [Xanthobacteraceae bacterium]